MGAKRYTYDDSPDLYQYEDRTCLTLHAALGFEVATKAPVRLEARGVLVRNNPYLTAGTIYTGESDQIELQVRASVRFRVSR